MAIDKREAAAAARLFREFTGRDPAAVDFMELPADRTLLAIGPVELIGYRATREGEGSNLYVHRFKRSARPVLAVSHDGRQLYLLAGAYRFTDRGIVDR